MDKPMNPWRLTECNGSRRYVYSPDKRYQLHQERNALRTWCVWVLYLSGQRIHEVHPMSRVGFVMVDALEYINEAAQVAV